MKQAKLKILEMLEAGKIDANEAVQLLDALKSNAYDDSFGIDEEKLHRFGQSVDSFARDFGGRVEGFYREVEPKIKKASHVVLEKTAAVFDEISKSLHETMENQRKAAEGQEGCCADSDCCCADNEPKEN